MSVLILGVNLPAEGEIKEIILHPDGNAHEYYKDRMYTAIPVPAHGDLIDREVLMDDIIGSMVFSGRKVPKEAAIVQKVLDIVGDANAIIPAEEGET